MAEGIFPRARGEEFFKILTSSVYFSLSEYKASYSDKIQTFFLKSKRTCLVLKPLGKDKSVLGVPTFLLTHLHLVHEKKSLGGLKTASELSKGQERLRLQPS